MRALAGPEPLLDNRFSGSFQKPTITVAFQLDQPTALSITVIYRFDSANMEQFRLIDGLVKLGVALTMEPGGALAKLFVTIHAIVGNHCSNPG